MRYQCFSIALVCIGILQPSYQAVHSTTTGASAPDPVEREAHSGRRHRRHDEVAPAPGILNELFVPSKNCRQLYEEGHLTSGVYTLYPRDRLGSFNVFCHMGLSPVGSDHGWTVIQRRLNADVDFNRSKEEYQFGFGQLEGNFWLGLENIKRLVDKATDGHQLYVEVKYDNYIVSKGLWDSFSLESSNTDWKIRISGVNKVVSSGIVLDLLGDVDGRKFGAMDSSENKACAVKVGGGWWFGESCPSESCYPNGHYSSGSDGLDAGIRGKLEIETLTLRTVVMAIRTR